MATASVLTFHDGKLDIPEDVQREWNLSEGSELKVVSSGASSILLERPFMGRRSVPETMAIFDSLIGVNFSDWLPAEREEVVARKEKLQAKLDDLIQSTDASLTEIKQTERAWELADDELDGGPFRRT